MSISTKPGNTDQVNPSSDWPHAHSTIDDATDNSSVFDVRDLPTHPERLSTLYENQCAFRPFHLRETIDQITNLGVTASTTNLAVSLGNETLLIRLPGYATTIGLTFSKPQQVELQALSRISKKPIFDLRAKRSSNRVLREPNHYTGHFHVFSWVDSGAAPVQAADEVSEPTSDQVSNRRLPLSPIRVEWSGAYLGNIAHLFELADQLTPRQFRQEHASCRRIIRPRRIAKNPNEKHFRKIVREFWKFARQLDDPFLDPNPSAWLKEEWWTEIQRNRIEEISFAPRNTEDASAQEEMILKKIQSLFDSVANVANYNWSTQSEPGHNPSQEWMRNTSAALTIHAAWQTLPAQVKNPSGIGGASLLAVCQHILNAFSPQGWRTTSISKTNRNSGRSKEPYCLFMHQFDKYAISAHRASSSLRTLQEFLTEQSALSREETATLLADL